MGRPTTSRPEQKVFDPTSPKHITDECVFCKAAISRKILQKPETVCNECHRPTCPDCIEDLKQTGLWGCWYCKTVDIDERNPEIQKELEKIREEKLRERRPDPVQEMGRVISTTGVWVSSSSDTQVSNPWRGGRISANADEYPYRDPDNILDRQEGWGAPATFDMSGEDEVKPGDFVQPSHKEFNKVEAWKPDKHDLMGVVGSKTMINKVTANVMELRKIAYLIMAGEKIDNKAFSKDETYGQIYTRIDWDAADTIAGYTLNEDARSHIVAEILKSLGQYYKDVKLKRHSPDRFTDVSFKNTVSVDKDSDARIKTVEEAQRGTGRTTQRIKSVFGHFVDGAVGLRKDLESRRLLYLVDSEREAKRINTVMTQEWEYGFYRKLGAATLATVKDRTDIMSVSHFLHKGVIGKNYTLVIADLTYETIMNHGKDLRTTLQYYNAPVIGDVITG